MLTTFLLETFEGARLPVLVPGDSTTANDSDPLEPLMGRAGGAWRLAVLGRSMLDGFKNLDPAVDTCWYELANIAA